MSSELGCVRGGGPFPQRVAAKPNPRGGGPMRLPLFVKRRPIAVADVGETIVPRTGWTGLVLGVAWCLFIGENATALDDHVASPGDCGEREAGLSFCRSFPRTSVGLLSCRGWPFLSRPTAWSHMHRDEDRLLQRDSVFEIDAGESAAILCFMFSQ